MQDTKNNNVNNNIHNENIDKEDMNIVIVGHVDHGKSTVIGRLLADTGSLPDGKLEQVKENCRRNSKPFEYAFLLDALKDEQAQGITIDSARCFFKTKKRDYIIIDAPGHIEFLKNMISGAARAEAALLVIDAHEGIQENSRRHGYMVSMLGVKQVAVLVNKMDLVNFDKKVYDDVIREYSEFLNKINVTPVFFIPISAVLGDNIAEKSQKMHWYKGTTVLEALDQLENAKLSDDKPFRMPVQDVYKFTKDKDNRRIVAGTVETGVLKVGDEVVFYPSGKKTRVKSIEAFNKEKQEEVSAGTATGFTTTEQIYTRRGEIATIRGEQKPKVGTLINVKLFWLGKKPMETNKKYYLKIGTAKAEVVVTEITNVLDASNLSSEKKETVNRNDVAECIMKSLKPIAFDLSNELIETSRFVVIDDYEIVGGGIIVEALEDDYITSQLEDHLRLFMGNYKIDISRKGSFGLRVIFDIAVHADDGLATLEQIASRQNIPETLLDEIISSFIKDGLLEQHDDQISFKLSKLKSYDEISMGSILHLIHEKIRVVNDNFVEYGLNTMVEDCLAMNIANAFNEKLNEVIEAISLQDLIARYDEVKSNSGTMYFI